MAVPNFARHTLHQNEVYRSLRTSSVREVQFTAQTLRIALGAFFGEFRMVAPVVDENEAQALRAAFGGMLKRLLDEVGPFEKSLSCASPITSDKLNEAVRRGRETARRMEMTEQRDNLLLDAHRQRCQQLNEASVRHRRDLSLVQEASAINLSKVVEAYGTQSSAALKAVVAHPVSIESPHVVACNRGTRPTTMTIMQVFDEFKALQIAKGAQDDAKGGWSNPGRVDVEQTVHVRAFIEFLEGDCPIDEVSDDDVMAFNDFVMTTETIKSASVRKQRLNRTAAVFKHAKKKRYIQNAFTEEFKFDGQIKKNPFLKYTDADLRALFESDAYRNHQHQTSSQFWLPLLGLHTGARLNELCQLLRSDIKEVEGIPVISILDEEENKRLKTEASRRIVPIHSTLIELGFLDFIRTIPKGRIFPHLREDPNKPGDFGQKATEDFTAYRRSVNVGNQAGQGKSRKAFHSFRSTFINAMRHAQPEPVPKDRRTRLVGHEYEDTHDDTYDGGDVLDMFPIATLKRDVESVRFDIEFTSYNL